MFAKGWHAAAILILKTILDENLVGYGISIFYVIINSMDGAAPSVFAWTMKNTIGSQNKNPSGFGILLLCFIGGAYLISAPLFYFSAHRYKEMRRLKI